MLLEGSSRGRIRLSRYNLGSGRSSRIYPLHAVHLAGRFLRLLSVYTVYQYLLLSGSSVVIFTFLCISTAAIVFLIIHRPWRGRSLTTYQLVPSIINGAFLAISYVLWGLGLRACGPLRTIMAEYVGAVLGAISTLILSRGGGKWKKVAGLVAMLASYLFFSQGWAIADRKIDGKFTEKESVGFQPMSSALLGGVLAGLCRVIARRVSLKTQMKRRLHVVTVVAASCFLFPVAVFEATQKPAEAKVQTHNIPIWTFILNTLFGIILLYYVDVIAEERLHISVASPKHLLVTSGCISILELIYGMDFSFLGFLICASLLGLGIFEATPLERGQRESTQLPLQADNFDALPNSLMMSPISDARQKGNDRVCNIINCVRTQ
ncbi:hypothetical protein GOP47_0017368 [Adiantum capillus-veneris]|uniref:Uncharacterized protein n=1 Tax=Adiantum capillus-veneris TaxID=13818 RepID=A0A9D4UFG7_ADICA|nr:hypothetical protein GOP47_0017368 [Adiantum capillus-veneris]